MDRITLALPSPFVGLRAFSEREALLFFGRDEHVRDLLAKLQRQQRFIAVMGSSGSGKSSLIRAGLVPALHRGALSAVGHRWNVCIFKPGDAPLTNLSQALTKDPRWCDCDDRPTSVSLLSALLAVSPVALADLYRQRAERFQGEALLLVVDQFEEIFRFRQKRVDEAETFIRLLLRAASEPLPIHVVITMRSDFLGNASAFLGLPEAINSGLYLTPRLGPDQLKSVIASPLGLVGGEIDPVLVNRLINSLGGADELPVLEHALLRMWNRALQEDRRRIEDADFIAICAPQGPANTDGGLPLPVHAIDNHASEIFHALSPDAQLVARRMFLALVEQREGRDVRRPQTIRQLVEQVGAEARAPLLAVIERFRADGVGFLQPPAAERLDDDTVIDITHESLMRVWGQLKLWRDEEARSVQTLRRLAETAALYRNRGTQTLEPPELDSARLWRARQQPTAAWAERYCPGIAEAMRFLQLSEAAWEERLRNEAATEAARRSAEEQQRQHEASARQNRRWGMTLGSVLLTALIAMFFLWTDARNEAEAARKAERTAVLAKEEAEKLQLSKIQNELKSQDLLVDKQRQASLLEHVNGALQLALKSASADTQARVEKTLNERPLVYIQYADPAQAKFAQQLSQQLNEASYSSPGVERVGNVPSRTELRYFRQEDATTALTLKAKLEQWNTGPVQLQLLTGKSTGQLRHFELWLASSASTDLAARVADLNSDNRATRLTAGQLLQSQYLDSPKAIALVLDTYAPQKLDALTTEGRINGLYYLSRSTPEAWTPELLARGRDVARSLDERDARGIGIGPQTRAELNVWKQKVLKMAPATNGRDTAY